MLDKTDVLSSKENPKRKLKSQNHRWTGQGVVAVFEQVDKDR